MTLTATIIRSSIITSRNIKQIYNDYILYNDWLYVGLMISKIQTQKHTHKQKYVSEGHV